MKVPSPVSGAGECDECCVAITHRVVCLRRHNIDRHYCDICHVTFDLWPFRETETGNSHWRLHCRNFVVALFLVGGCDTSAFQQEFGEKAKDIFTHWKIALSFVPAPISYSRKRILQKLLYLPQILTFQSLMYVFCSECKSCNALLARIRYTLCSWSDVTITCSSTQLWKQLRKKMCMFCVALGILCNILIYIYRKHKNNNVSEEYSPAGA
jgi:hypothetical protein